MIVNVGIFLRLYFLCGFHHHILDEFQFLLIAYKRNHNFRNNMVAVFFVYFYCRFHNGPGLHPCNFRIGYGKTAASVAHHGIELMQAVTGSLYFRYSQVHISCKIFKILLLRGNELMKRGIQKTDGNRVVLHYLINPSEITLLERNQLIQGFFPGFTGGGKDHLTDLRNTFRIKEHMLRTAQADAFRAQLQCIGSILRGIGIGSYLQHTERIRPVHNTSEVAADGSIFRCDIAVVNLTGRTVKRNIISFMISLAAKAEYFSFFIHCNITAAGYTCGAHASCHNSRMGSHSSAYGKDTFGSMHSFNILR